ncbi:MAG TPA: epimerase, partial [Acidobacteriaceae bacterium]|nr:epimerase [Acidobacteriaceae bacterium]
KTRVYQIVLVLAAPVLPLLRRAFPRSISTTREIGQAMLFVARNGWPRPLLESKDIHAAAIRTP